MQEKNKRLILSAISCMLIGVMVADYYNNNHNISSTNEIIEEISLESMNDKYVRLVETAQQLKQQKLEEQMALELEQERLRLQQEEEKIIEEEENLFLQQQEYLYEQEAIEYEDNFYSNEMEFTLTFYTCLPSENLGYTTTAWGEVPQYGMVASNVYDKGTRIYLDGYGEFVVADRGGSNFDSYNRLDVFIPRIDGESDYEYSQRVMALGVVDVKGYIIN